MGRIPHCLGVAALALTAGVAAALTRCDARYTMQPGDSLYKVAQGCRVSMNRIIASNPDLSDIHSIPAGTELDLARNDSAAPDPETSGS